MARALMPVQVQSSTHSEGARTRASEVRRRSSTVTVRVPDSCVLRCPVRGVSIEQIDVLWTAPICGRDRGYWERERLISSSPSVGHFSRRPLATQPFPLVHVLGQEGWARSGHGCSGRRSAPSAVRWECLTRIGAKVTVRSTSPSLRRFGLSFLGRERKQGEGGACRASFERWPGDGSDTQGELPGTARRCNQGWEDVDRKVRTER